MIPGRMVIIRWGVQLPVVAAILTVRVWIEESQEEVAELNGPFSIAEMETPANAQEEEAYLKEVMKGSLSETEGGAAATTNGGARSYTPPLPQHKEEGNLLIDFMVAEPEPVPAP